MLETLSVFQWSILALAALCIGMSKTGVQGMMLLIVPYMAMAFGAKESTGVILPMLCMADIMAVAYYKRIADWKTVAKLLPTALLGFLVALFVDKLVPAQGFRQLMGWTLALAMAVMIWSEIFGKENRWMHKWWYSALFGLLGGFTTMIGNAAGPVMSVYLLSMRKEKMEYIGINGLVLPRCQSAESSFPNLCLGQYHLGLVITEPPDASGNRNRSLARNPSGKTLPRKSLPKIHPNCHNTFCSNDARIGH